MATPETRRQLLAAVAACDDKKGEDTRILELDPADSGLADFFLITSGSNDRQIVAIADEIELRLKREFGLYPASVEGRRQAEWILLDYIDIVIHVFLSEKRAFYDIERLRKSARSLTPGELEADLRAALAAKTRAVRDSASGKSTSKKAAKAASPEPRRKASSPKTTTKGDSNVTAKPAGKAAKKAAPKPSFKAGKEIKASAKTSTAKVPSKAASKAAPAPAKTVGVRAPAASFGAQPPITKAEAPPDAISLAASASKSEKPAKAVAKKPAKKAAALVVNKLRAKTPSSEPQKKGKK